MNSQTPKEIIKILAKMLLFVLYTLIAEPTLFLIDILGLTKQNPELKYVKSKVVNWKAVIWYITIIILGLIFKEQLIQFKEFMFSKSIFNN